jgi:hypothetical protein
MGQGQQGCKADVSAHAPQQDSPVQICKQGGELGGLLVDVSGCSDVGVGVGRVAFACKLTTCSRDQESVCSLDPLDNDRYYYINPWLGGAFNVFEATDDFQEGGCDTTLMDPAYVNGYVNPVVIDSSCLVDGPQCKLDDGTALGYSQPNICKARQGQNPKYPEPVPRGSLHNMCMQKPSLLPATCTHRQGMLHGLQGDPVGNLYTPVQMSKILGADVDPGGLYSNPLFLGNDNMDPITASYGRVYMDKGEIAGHHIVYGVTADEVSCSLRAMNHDEYNNCM